MPKDDGIIWVEDIDPDLEEFEEDEDTTFVIAISMNRNGTVNFHTKLDHHQTCSILNGLAGHILETYLG